MLPAVAGSLAFSAAASAALASFSATFCHPTSAIAMAVITSNKSMWSLESLMFIDTPLIVSF